MATLVQKSLEFFERTAAYIDQAGRILLIEIKLNHDVFVIANVYTATKDEPVFFDAFFNTCKFFKTRLGFRLDLESSA